MNRENLIKLADYLWVHENKKSLFDMSRWSDGWSNHNCGTAGCSVGHGPYAGIPKIDSELWVEYAERVFELWNQSSDFAWLFWTDWADTDNTALGAAKRIFYLLEHGLPTDWRYQMHGRSPLCYLDQQPLNN